MVSRRQRGGWRISRELTRRQQLVALKERSGFTWAKIAEITGWNWTVLKQYSCGAKPVSQRALEFITLKLAEHASTSKQTEQKSVASPF